MALSEITNYIEDDWDDNALTNRTGSEEGYYLHPSDNLISDFEAGDTLKGVYRPDWNIFNGSPSVSNQELVLPVGDTTTQSVGTPSKLTIGEFSYDFRFTSTSSTTGEFVSNILTNENDAISNNGYITYWTIENSDAKVIERTNGSNTDIIATTWSTDTNYHTSKVERSAYGSFELFLDGTSLGTGTDSNHTKTVNTSFRNNTDVEIRCDNVVIQ